MQIVIKHQGKKSLANASKRVGVLTFHRCINYGSYWQARCLVERLIAGGLDAVVIDHDSRRANLAEWKCAYRPLLPAPAPRSDYPHYRTKIKNFFQAFESLPLSARVNLDDPSDIEDFDAVVVGSDEVWNLCHPWYGGAPLFFGSGIGSQRLISYAASFGSYNAAAGLPEPWVSKLREFEYISVRDENSRSLIEIALGFEPVTVLDPCLLFPPKPDERPFAQLEPEFLAVYGHNFTTGFIDAIRLFARERRLALVSIGYRNDWADVQWLTADPHDFAHFMSRAAAVATNFFHGCIFCLLHLKSFVCEATDYRSNKIRDLLKLVGGERHIMSGEHSSADFVGALTDPIDAVVPQNIAALRTASDQYLENALA